MVHGVCIVSNFSELLFEFFVVTTFVMSVCIVHVLLVVSVGVMDSPLTGLHCQVVCSMLRGNIADVFLPMPISWLLCHWVALSWRNLVHPVFVVPALPA